MSHNIYTSIYYAAFFFSITLYKLKLLFLCNNNISISSYTSTRKDYILANVTHVAIIIIEQI